MAKLSSSRVAAALGLTYEHLTEWNSNLNFLPAERFKSGTQLTVPVLPVAALRPASPPLRVRQRLNRIADKQRTALAKTAAKNATQAAATAAASTTSLVRRLHVPCFSVGQCAFVESRTMPGSNYPGGVGTITAVTEVTHLTCPRHIARFLPYNGYTTHYVYNVKYAVSRCTEKCIDPRWISNAPPLHGPYRAARLCKRATQVRREPEHPAAPQRRSRLLRAHGTTNADTATTNACSPNHTERHTRRSTNVRPNSDRPAAQQQRSRPPRTRETTTARVALQGPATSRPDQRDRYPPEAPD